MRRGDSPAVQRSELGQWEGSSPRKGWRQSPGLTFPGEQPHALKKVRGFEGVVYDISWEKE